MVSGWVNKIILVFASVFSFLVSGVVRIVIKIGRLYHVTLTCRVMHDCIAWFCDKVELRRDCNATYAILSLSEMNEV